MSIEEYFDFAITTLQQLIEIPSLSCEENQTADLLQYILESNSVNNQRVQNNVIGYSSDWVDSKPTILLCSHHDTVKPNKGYTRDPFHSKIENGRLYGLGANDAGGSLVSMLSSFLALRKLKLPFNMIIALVGEEEISGSNGIQCILQELPSIHLGIVGEPTELELAVAERGLLVIDGLAQGPSGHVANLKEVTSIHIACSDIMTIDKFDFSRLSKHLGKTRATCTQILAGDQHNVLPTECSFVVDVRVNDQYQLEEVFQQLNEVTESTLSARSFRLKPSSISLNHPFIRHCIAAGVRYYGSNTLSDQALMPFDTVKVGCGNSERSHTADEYIFLDDIKKGILWYYNLLKAYIPE